LADESDRVRDGFRKSITIIHINQAKSRITKCALAILRYVIWRVTGSDLSSIHSKQGSTSKIAPTGTSQMIGITN